MTGATGPKTSSVKTGEVERDLGEHGRPVEEPVVLAARGQPRALVDARGDQAVDLVPRPLVDDRTERDLLGGRVADRQVAGLRGELVDEVVVDPVGDEVAAGGHADLALVEERRPAGQPDRLLDVRVVEDQQRRVAAQLEVRPLEVAARELADRPARPRSSR